MTTTADVFQLPFPPSTFGNRFGIHSPAYGPQGHRGTDFIVPPGTDIPVIANGVVVRVGWSNSLGNITVVKHYLAGDGAANDVYTGYAHQLSVGVKSGQAVRRGQPIGKVGTTGLASTGPHLHLTMSHHIDGIIFGEVFDPIAYVQAHVAAAQPVKPATAKVRTTTARRGEGLSLIAERSGISLAAIERLNPHITGPEFLVLVGQKVRIA